MRYDSISNEETPSTLISTSNASIYRKARRNDSVDSQGPFPLIVPSPNGGRRGVMRKNSVDSQGPFPLIVPSTNGGKKRTDSIHSQGPFALIVPSPIENQKKTLPQNDDHHDKKVAQKMVNDFLGKVQEDRIEKIIHLNQGDRQAATQMLTQFFLHKVVSEGDTMDDNNIQRHKKIASTVLENFLRDTQEKRNRMNEAMKLGFKHKHRKEVEKLLTNFFTKGKMETERVKEAQKMTLHPQDRIAAEQMLTSFLRDKHNEEGKYHKETASKVLESFLIDTQEKRNRLIEAQKLGLSLSHKKETEKMLSNFLGKTLNERDRINEAGKISLDHKHRFEVEQMLTSFLSNKHRQEGHIQYQDYSRRKEIAGFVIDNFLHENQRKRERAEEARRAGISTHHRIEIENLLTNFLKEKMMSGKNRVNEAQKMTLNPHDRRGIEEMLTKFLRNKHKDAGRNHRKLASMLLDNFLKENEIKRKRLNEAYSMGLGAKHREEVEELLSNFLKERNEKANMPRPQHPIVSRLSGVVSSTNNNGHAKLKRSDSFSSVDSELDSSEAKIYPNSPLHPFVSRLKEKAFDSVSTTTSVDSELDNAQVHPESHEMKDKIIYSLQQELAIMKIKLKKQDLIFKQMDRDAKRETKLLLDDALDKINKGDKLDQAERLRLAELEEWYEKSQILHKAECAEQEVRWAKRLSDLAEKHRRDIQLLQKNGPTLNESRTKKCTELSLSKPERRVKRKRRKASAKVKFVELQKQEQYVRLAIQKFDEFDKDKSGYLDKEETLQVADFIFNDFHLDGKKLIPIERNRMASNLLMQFNKKHKFSFREFEQWFKTMCNEIRDLRQNLKVIKRNHAMTRASGPKKRKPRSLPKIKIIRNKIKMSVKKEHLVRRARKKFQEMDSNNDGVLSERELIRLARWFYHSFHPNEEPLGSIEMNVLVTKLRQRIDQNYDGKIDFHEFLSWYDETCQLLKKFHLSKIK
eukprot:g2041.t1